MRKLPIILHKEYNKDSFIWVVEMVAFPNAISRLDSSGTKFISSFINSPKENVLFMSVPITTIKGDSKCKCLEKKILPAKSTSESPNIKHNRYLKRGNPKKLPVTRFTSICSWRKNSNFLTWLSSPRGSELYSASHVT